MTKDEIYQELRTTLQQLNSQIELVFERSRTQWQNPYDLTYSDGKPVLSPLLVAKADVLKTMIELRRMETA